MNENSMRKLTTSNVLIVLAGLIFCGMAIYSCIKYPLESGLYIFSEAGRTAHRKEIEVSSTGPAPKKENDWIGGVTLWDAISGNTTPEYERAVAARSRREQETQARRWESVKHLFVSIDFENHEVGMDSSIWIYLTKDQKWQLTELANNIFDGYVIVVSSASGRPLASYNAWFGVKILD